MLNSYVNCCVGIALLIHIKNDVIVKQITYNYEFFYLDRRMVKLFRREKVGLINAWRSSNMN